MDIQASKIELAKMILETEDIAIIKKIRNIFSGENNLSKKEKKAVDEALEEIKQGRAIPHNTVMLEMKKKYPQYFK